jgi:hypothetical protein
MKYPDLKDVPIIKLGDLPSPPPEPAYRCDKDGQLLMSTMVTLEEDFAEAAMDLFDVFGPEVYRDNPTPSIAKRAALKCGLHNLVLTYKNERKKWHKTK